MLSNSKRTETSFSRFIVFKTRNLRSGDFRADDRHTDQLPLAHVHGVIIVDYNFISHTQSIQGRSLVVS